MTKQFPPDSPSSTTIPVQATPVLLDSVDGLERILGNRRLYGQLLRRFQHDHAQAALALGDLLKSGNYDAALCMAHRLKGAAGMIGARAVEKMAGGIEENLRQLVPAKPELLLPELQDLLLQTGDVIAAALTELPCDETVPQAHAGAPDTAAMTMTHQEISDVANRLACLLDEGDGEAIDLLDSSASALAGLLGVDKYQEVAAAAHEFDFEAALGALRRPR